MVNNPNVDINMIKYTIENVNNYLKGYNYLHPRVSNICNNMYSKIASKEFKFGFDYEFDVPNKQKLVNHLYGINVDYKDVLLYRDMLNINDDDEQFEFFEPLSIQLHLEELPSEMQTGTTIFACKNNIKPKNNIYDEYN